MSESKTFTSGTLINSGWLNAVDATTFEALGDGSLNPPTTAVQVRTNLGLPASTGSSLIGHIASGAGATATTVQAKLRQTVSVKDFGAVGDGTTDDTAAINAAYLAANANDVLFIPPGVYKFTSQLLWDKTINVYGSGNNSRLIKTGNFDGIKLEVGAGQCTYSNFTIEGAVGNGGKGLVVKGISFAIVEKLFIYNHGGTGIYLDDTNHTLGMYHNVFRNNNITTNGGAGIIIDSIVVVPGGQACNVCHFENNSIVGNSGVGFYQYGDPSVGYHSGIGNVIEQNAGGGMQLEGIGNDFASVYLEANTTYDLKLAVTSIRNHIQIIASTIAFQDFGTNNVVLDIATTNSLNVGPTIQRSTRANDTAGSALSISAGTGGPGAGQTGGALTVIGGSGGGTNGSGGGLYLKGGEKTGSGERGVVYIQDGNDQVSIWGGVNGLVPGGTSCSVDFVSTTRVPCLPRLTTTQKNALTPTNGFICYDSTLNKFQGYENGAWVSFI